MGKFSWAKNTNWTQFYSEGSEILQYCKDVVDSHKLMRYFQLSHKIIGAYWDSRKGVWDIHIENLVDGRKFVDTAEVFINCSGILKYVLLISVYGVF